MNAKWGGLVSVRPHVPRWKVYDGFCRHSVFCVITKGFGVSFILLLTPSNDAPFELGCI